MIYCVNRVKSNTGLGGNTAWKKAPDDIMHISEKFAHKIIFLDYTDDCPKCMSKISHAYTDFSNWLKMNACLKEGDVVILQHPYEGVRIGTYFMDKYKKRGVKFIVLIHDLLTLRQATLSDDVSERKRKRLSRVEFEVFDKADVLICHNLAMRKYLEEKSVPRKKIYELEIFDYLHDCALERGTREKSIAIAGNLARKKCEYLYKLCDSRTIRFQLHLFGPNYTGAESSENVIYHGVCTPDELPGKLEGSFGLVWDGTEIDRCAGNAGEYIKFNNPHKCSLFLASNMPVIIWKQAALAPFVEENGVGITVNSLMEIGDAIDNLTETQYAEMLENTKRIGEKLRSGFYFKKALAQTGLIEQLVTK